MPMKPTCQRMRNKIKKHTVVAPREGGERKHPKGEGRHDKSGQENREKPCTNLLNIRAHKRVKRRNQHTPLTRTPPPSHPPLPPSPPSAQLPQEPQKDPEDRKASTKSKKGATTSEEESFPQKRTQYWPQGRTNLNKMALSQRSTLPSGLGRHGETIKAKAGKTSRGTPKGLQGHDERDNEAQREPKLPQGPQLES